MKRTHRLFGAAMACLCVAVAVAALGCKPKKTEREVTLEQVPAAVKETILKEAGDNKIEEISVEGKVVCYEAEWEVGDKEIEIEVAPDGTLLKKEVEDADDDDDDDDD